MSLGSGLYQLFGNVSLETTEVLIRADEMTYDTTKNLVTAQGHVTVHQNRDNTTYTGNVVEFNVRSHEWRFTEWATTFPPGYLGKLFIGSLFVGGEKVTGDDRTVQAANTDVTTCNLAVPHYYVVSRRVDIYPGDKLIAWNNYVYIHGVRVLYLPYMFLSLQDSRSPILPEFGQNTTEGTYLRMLYQYVIDRNNVGGVRTDFTSKLGTGIGVRHYYSYPDDSGTVFLYGRRTLHEYVASITHNQTLPLDTTATITYDRRENSLLTAQSTTSTNINTLFIRKTPNSSSQLTFTRNQVDGDYGTDTTSANLLVNATTGIGIFDDSLEYSRFANTGASTAGTPADQELWNRFKYTEGIGIADLHADIDKRFELNGSAFNETTPIQGTQRLPELYLQSDQNYLHGQLFQLFPSQLRLGWGRFAEPVAGAASGTQLTDLDRYNFSWTTTPTLTLGRHLTLTAAESFRQMAYGDHDNTALYVLGTNASAITRFGNLTNTATYSRQSSHGFTPFSFDAAFPYESTTDSINYTTSTMSLYLTSGRDMQNARWQDLSFRGNLWLTQHFYTTQAVGYDPNTSTWRDLVGQFVWLQNPRLRVNLGTRYNLEQSKFSRIGTNLQWTVTPNWRLSWLGGYDGINYRYLYNEFLITRDMHCWDVSLYYSSQNHAGYIYFRLKAIGAALPSFGIGKGGNSLTNTTYGTPY